MERPIFTVLLFALTAAMAVAVVCCVGLIIKEEVVDKRAWDKLIGPGLAIIMLLLWWFNL